MTDRPILFSGSMVQALLDGRKTQTRRVIRGVRQDNCLPVPKKKNIVTHVIDAPNWPLLLPVKVSIGDRLWVKEAHYAHGYWTTLPDTLTKSGKPKREFVRDWDHSIKFERPEQVLEGRPEAIVGWHWRTSSHMWRRDSRLTLPVTDVRVQLLQNIASDDAEAEGLLCGETDGGDLVWSGIHQEYPIPEQHCCEWPEEAFAELWASINGPAAWESNPWVVAYSFTVQNGNIDAVAA